nr:putative ribonuclease H-like domain-containing protein [Tanacetum cinerariifolium]
MAFISSAKHNSGNEDGNTACVPTASTNVPTAKFALMANTCAESMVFENCLCSKDCKKNNDSLNSKITYLADKLFDAKNMIYHYKLGLAQVESRLVEYKEREVKYCKKIKTIEFRNGSNNECIEILKKKIETLKQEKEGVDGKLAGLLTASKNLDNLNESQRSDKNKDGLEYSAVPPPPAQLYSSPKKDLSWTGLPEFADDTITDYSRSSPTMEITSGNDQNRNPSVSETVASPITPKPFIKFVKPKDSQTKSKTDETVTPKKPPVKKRVKKSFTPKPVAYRPPKNFTYSRNFPTANRKFPTASRKFPAGSPKCSTADMGMKGKVVKPSACWFWKPSQNLSNKGNISYLSNFEPFAGGHVSFGQGGCKITRKGTIKTDKVEFENMYFMKDLKDFKLLDDANILLRTPRQHNMHFIDLNNIVPHRDLTCLVAKASADEYLFGPTSISSISHKRYCLVVTDDFSRFTWTFFLKSKDETSGILKKFITEIENLKDLKVKIIRCDNGGEFRNKEMNDICSQKSIKREFSNARTPQQNGVAERRNRTLIEAARTMLADAKLPDPEFPAKVYKVEKAMYGLHQAPRAWYGTLSKYLLKNGFQRGTIDQTLFIRREFEALMHEKFQMSAMGELNFFLGLQVLQKEDGIFLSQDNNTIMVTLQFYDYHNMVAILEKSEHNIDFHPMMDFIEASPLSNTIMVTLQFYDYHNMVAILEKSEHNIDFHPMMDFIEASPLRIETTEEGTQILATVDGFNEFSSNIATALVYLATNRTYNFSKMIFDGLVKNVNNNVSKFLMYPRIVPLFYTMLVQQGEGSGTPTEPHYTPSPEAQPPSPTTHSSPTLPPVTTTFISAVTPSETTPIRHYTRIARIAQSSALLTIADEPDSPLRDVSQGEACPTDSGFIADQDRATIAKSSTFPHDSAPRVTSPAADEGTQEVEINRWKERVKLLEDRDGVAAQRSGDDALIKGISINEGEAAAKRISVDSEEMETVLTSMDAATVLAEGIANVPTGSGSIPTASPPADEVPTGSDVVPTTSLVFSTATVVTPYRRRKGKEVMVESETLKKQIVQEQIDAQFASELPMERGIEMISDLVKYQDNYAKAERIKSKDLSLEQESAKKQKISKEVTEEAKTPDEIPEEKVKEMMQLVPIEEVYVEALQRLVNEILSNRPPTSDKEMELWVELSRLYEPDHEDQLWTHTQNFMHAPVEWKLYDSCGVHHVTSKYKEIFMLVEKDYPLRKGLALVMISYKLQVENYSHMANDLILKIYKIAKLSNIARIVGNKMHKAFLLPVIKFPLAEELPTTSEESYHCQKKSEATAVKIALLLKVNKKLSVKVK